MILITGATGLSGHFVALELLRRGNDDRTLRQALAFQPGWIWQQTVAASVALAADDSSALADRFQPAAASPS
jgi:nucleoside-diphosphate-sugar epimerase